MGKNLSKIKAVQGHIDSSFDDERWMGASSESAGFNFWFMGEDPDGPVVTCGTAPPNPDGHETAPAHSHPADTIRIILEGSFKVGNKWYKAGDMRIQEAGRIYGPETVGPDGCRQLVIFEKRSSVSPKYANPKSEAVQVHLALSEYVDGLVASVS